ncbi:MAG TPA: ice-binding family protein [Thermoanaerobaculia bacterium]|nr:ice-binding family protein [Thermoanaerobaculia bacterium]
MCKPLILLVNVGFVALLSGASAGWAQPVLGSAQTFSVLGASTVTNTGSTLVTGDLGVSPGSAVTGFPPGIVTGGTIHAGDAVALQAQTDLTAAYNTAAATPCTADLTGQDLGGLTLTPGVYCFNSSAQLTGTLTLNAQGNAGAVFLFKIGSTLTTASNSSVLLINGGSSCNVTWQVGSSATLGTGTAFGGNILALTSITLNTGARVSGRALARNGAVTLDTSNVAGCAGAITAVPTLSGSGMLLLAAFLALFGAAAVRRRMTRSVT